MNSSVARKCAQITQQLKNACCIHEEKYVEFVPLLNGGYIEYCRDCMYILSSYIPDIRKDPMMIEEERLEDTHSIWNKQISRILCRAYGDRVINSEQLHILAAAFDPTQDHKVYGEFANTGFKE